MIVELKPLAAQLAEILELPTGATESAVAARVSEWAADRKRQQDSAAFERRIAALVATTNMIREEAIRCITEQDRAALATA